MLWDERLTELAVSVDRRGVDTSQKHWRIIAVWRTRNGSWDDVPTWARQWQQDTLGGDHHAFGRALFADGTLAPQAGFVLGWPDGVDGRTPEPDGWANIPLFAGYNPAQGPGPYSWAKAGNAEKLVGLGLPHNHHVSFFAVWQEMEPGTPEPPPTGEWITVEVDVAGVLLLPNVRVRVVA